MGCLRIKYGDGISAPKNWKVFIRGVEKKNRSQKKGLDYYPFGMEMPGRKYSSEAYRYGYQGQFAEKDGETSLHHFELRQWDARIARWISTDPAGQYFSPYMGMGNNPISLVDPDGAYSKFGAWWRNGFSSKGMDRVNGEWGFYEVSMSGSSSFNANGNFTTMDMNIQFNGSDGLSQAYFNATDWNGSLARSFVKDVYSIGLSAEAAAFLGSGTEHSLTLMTRGEAGVYYTPSVVGTGGSTIEANANVTFSSGNYTGNPADLRANNLHGGSGGVNVGVGAGLRGSVGVAVGKFSLGGRIITTNFEVGLGIEGSPATVVGVQGFYKNTIAVVPLIKF